MKEQLAQYLRTYSAVPLTIQYHDPKFDPLAAFQKLNQPNQPAFLLTGKPKEKEDGYSFICLNSEMTYRYRDYILTTTDLRNGNQHQEKADFKQLVNDLLANTHQRIASLHGWFDRVFCLRLCQIL